MPIEIMTDLETLSTDDNALILTLGACAFDIDTGKLCGQKYIRFSVEDQKTLGRHVSESTVAWWNRQSEAARNEAFNPIGALPLAEACKEFDDWVVSTRKLDPKMELYMWANDPDFDLVKLTNAFRAVGKEPPWQYWEYQSVRTMKRLAKKLKLTLPPREGTHHNAVDDAIHQTKIVTTVWAAT